MMGHSSGGGNGFWLATRNFDVLDIGEWDVVIVDEPAAATERRLRVWARAVKAPFDPPMTGRSDCNGKRILNRKFRWRERKR